MRPTRKSTWERVIAVMALVLVISIGILVPKALREAGMVPLGVYKHLPPDGGKISKLSH